MQPRTALTIGATLAGAVALVVALVPADRLAGLLALAPDDAATFLLQRYAASATAAVAVTSLGIARGQAPERSALFGLATWFAVQALAVVVGLATGTVGGVAWLAVVADPVLATGFAVLARRAGQSASKPRSDPAASTAR
jgi:hypothetical protein